MANIIFYDFMSDAIQNSDVYLFPYDVKTRGDFDSAVWDLMCPDVPPHILDNLVTPQMYAGTRYNLIGVAMPVGNSGRMAPVFFARTGMRSDYKNRMYSTEQLEIILKIMNTPPLVTTDFARLLSECINMRPTEFGGGLFIYDAPARIDTAAMQLIEDHPYSGDVNLEDIPF